MNRDRLVGLAAFAIGILAVPSLAVADIGPTTGAQVDQALARLLSYRNSISIDRPIPLGRALHEIATYLAPGEIPMRVSPLVADCPTSPIELRDQPIATMLDRLLAPHGFHWIVESGVVVIYADLQTRVFPIRKEDLEKVALLRDERRLGTLIDPAASGDRVPGIDWMVLDAPNATLVADGEKSLLDRIPAGLARLRDESKEQVYDRLYQLTTRSFRIVQYMRKDFDAFAKGIQLGDDSIPSTDTRTIRLLQMTADVNRTVTVRGLVSEVKKFENELIRRGLGAAYDSRMDELDIILVKPEAGRKLSDEAIRQANQETEYVQSLLYMENGQLAAAEKGLITHLVTDREHGCMLTILDYFNRLRAFSYLFRDRPQIAPSVIAKDRPPRAEVMAALESPDPAVRLGAMSVLDQLKNPGTVDLLLKFWDEASPDRATSATQRTLREQRITVARGLGRIGDARGADPIRHELQRLVDAVRTTGRLDRDDLDAINYYSVALAQIHDIQAVPLFKSMLLTGPEQETAPIRYVGVAQIAADSLGMLGFKIEGGPGNGYRIVSEPRRVPE